MSKFYWGCATAAFQIEGALQEEGRGESIWDRMCRTPGKIVTGENADITCDHFHRWREDIQWMKRLGVNAYRFSLAWPRLLPDGVRTNQRGVDFYRRLCGELRDNGIEPFVTLYHWDLPQCLEDAGGWTQRSTVEAFAVYAVTALKGLGDMVEHWMTLNEPWCCAVYGYGQGIQAPGRREAPPVLARVIHHLLLAHGYGVGAVREFGTAASEVGIVLNPFCVHPGSDTPADVAACDAYWHLENDWWLEPLYSGHYPEGGWRGLFEARPPVESGDMALISAPTDFLGLNLYSSQAVSCDWSALLGFRADEPCGAPRAGGMPLVPGALADNVMRIQRQWPVKQFYIAENGIPGGDEIQDDERCAALADCLRLVGTLRRDGVPLSGYFYWSLLDNFEWMWGYSKRFGLLHVDFERGALRTPKSSFELFRNWIAAHPQP